MDGYLAVHIEVYRRVILGVARERSEPVFERLQIGDMHRRAASRIAHIASAGGGNVGGGHRLDGCGGCLA